MTIKEMSIEELAALRREIECELTIRKNQEQEELWLKVRKALADWYDFGGTLYVETWSDSIRVPRKVNLDTMGVFNMEDCEAD